MTTDIYEGREMPIYQCFSRTGLLTDSAKATIAAEMTSVYCNFTGAPASWVNVLFHEMPEGDFFTAGRPAPQSLILAINRRGRDLETRQAMLRELSQIWTRNSGQPEDELWISVTEIDPTNVLDAGRFIPAAGHEREWLEENRDRLAGSNIPAA